MQKFKCHKVVEAAQIVAVDRQNSGGGPVTSGMFPARYVLVFADGSQRVVLPPWYDRHRPGPLDGSLVGGYFIRYEDGYESWSPAATFEQGYTPIDDGTPVDVAAAIAGDAREHILRYFAFQHLPPKLQLVSRPFAVQAAELMTLPRSPERTVALRKLLESKDAAVRAALENVEPTDGQ